MDITPELCLLSARLFERAICLPLQYEPTHEPAPRRHTGELIIYRHGTRTHRLVLDDGVSEMGIISPNPWNPWPASHERKMGKFSHLPSRFRFPCFVTPCGAWLTRRPRMTFLDSGAQYSVAHHPFAAVYSCRSLLSQNMPSHRAIRVKCPTRERLTPRRAVYLWMDGKRRGSFMPCRVAGCKVHGFGPSCVAGRDTTPINPLPEALQPAPPTS